MEWLEMKIDTSHAGLDPVCAMLEQQGVTGWMIDDETDFQDFLEHNRQYWDYVSEELEREMAEGSTTAQIQENAGEPEQIDLNSL